MVMRPGGMSDVRFVKNGVVVKEYGLKGASVMGSEGLVVSVDDIVASLKRLITTSLDTDTIQVDLFKTVVYVYGAKDTSTSEVNKSIVHAKGFEATDTMTGRFPVEDLLTRVWRRITLARIDALVASATPG